MRDLKALPSRISRLFALLTTMYHNYIYLYLSFLCLSVTADTYTVKVETEQFVNLVDSKFLSFTIDPRYLFSSSEKYNSKECICMASSLTPAYIRIAGPSTSFMTFRNSTIAIDDVNEPKKLSLGRLFRDDDESSNKMRLAVTHEEWEKFVHWAKNTGFDLVFALNSDEKTSSGMWDPNIALNILTVADKAHIGEIFWQLGYECTNQSIEEYLNDLETLRVIIETFPLGKEGEWHVVGGDVTNCLQADSKSDFKDYVTLSNDMMDAILLNGNSSSQELERMSEKDRLKLLKLLSHSDTPLWLTEHTHMVTELDRAADWMTSLGYSARNGFSVHYRELLENELYEPTLSFYMALLFKNLVGDRVLSVDIDSSQSIVFAHCTSLRHKPVSGAITLYGVNMDEEPARFSIKLTKKEDGGDIMQFILGHDHNGNIVVNNRAMYHEGDIRPVVKRVRPYKTLLLNLPPKSFGFWVLANTRVEACNDNRDILNNLLKNKDKEGTNSIKAKRSINDDSEIVEDVTNSNMVSVHKALKERIDNINNDLRNIHKKIKANTNKVANRVVNRIRRDTYEDNLHYKKPRRHTFKFLHSDNIRSNIYNKLSKLSKGHMSRIKNGLTKISKNKKRNLRKNTKRTFKSRDASKDEYVNNDLNKKNELIYSNEDESNNKINRKRRSVKNHSVKEHDEDITENEIPLDTRETFKVGNFLHKLKKLSELPVEVQETDTAYDDLSENVSEEGIVVKTQIQDDSAIIDITEKSGSGLLKSTLQDIMTLLADFNKNINRFWTAVTFLE